MEMTKSVGGNKLFLSFEVAEIMGSGIELVLKITVTVIIEEKFWFSYVSFLLFWAAECLLLTERGGLVFCFPWQQEGWQ